MINESHLAARIKALASRMDQIAGPDQPSPGPPAAGITGRQLAYLARLQARAGLVKYQAAMQRAGLPAELGPLDLSKSQASRLIAELVRN